MAFLSVDNRLTIHVVTFKVTFRLSTLTNTQMEIFFVSSLWSGAEIEIWKPDLAEVDFSRVGWIVVPKAAVTQGLNRYFMVTDTAAKAQPRAVGKRLVDFSKL